MILFKKTLEFKFTFSITWIQAFLALSLLIHFGLLFHIKYDLLAPFQDEGKSHVVSVQLRHERAKPKKPTPTRPSKDSKNLNHLLSMLEDTSLEDFEEVANDEKNTESPLNFDELMSSLLNKNLAENAHADETDEMLLTQKIAEMIGSKTEQFQGCYEKRLLSGDILEGHADFLLVIRQHQISDVAIDFKGRGHPKQIEELKNCLKDVSRSVRFNDDLGHQTVKFGLILKS